LRERTGRSACRLSAAQTVTRDRRLTDAVRTRSRAAANVVVQLAPLNAYEKLLGDSLMGDAAMNTNNVTDTARLSLNELQLPAIKLLWPQFAEQADKEGWPAARPDYRSVRPCAARRSNVPRKTELHPTFG
jgi:hypothetical protein